MYCDRYDDYVNEDECYDCSNQCSKNQAAGKIKKETAELMEKLRSSELAEEVKASFMKLVGCDEEKAGMLIATAFDDAFRGAERAFKTALSELARQKAVEYVDIKAKKALDDAFDRAMGERMLLLDGDKESRITTIRKIIADKIKVFLSKKDDRNTRNNIQETVERAIEKVVDTKVTEALEEITEECIEKYNKEVMKKMMQGMAGAIQSDKRLLAVMTNE